MSEAAVKPLFSKERMYQTILSPLVTEKAPARLTWLPLDVTWTV